MCHRRHSSSWLLCSSALHRSRIWRPTRKIDCPNHYKCICTRTRPIWKLCHPVYLYVPPRLPNILYFSNRTFLVDLAEPQFTEPLCQTFLGNISALSKQKFSSNVIEKCIRTADPHVQRAFVREMLGPNNELERMLRDSFANYVVQTAMDFVDAETRNALIDAIRPILPAIRQTPHGRRISGKIMTMDTHSRSNSISNGQVASSAAGNEDGLGYRQSFPLTATAGQFPSSQFNVPDTPTSGPLRSPDLDSTSDGGSSTIFSPIPQHTNHAINGINGINGVNGVNGSNSHGYNMF